MGKTVTYLSRFFKGRNKKKPQRIEPGRDKKLSNRKHLWEECIITVADSIKN
jgi:hypothetical protein